MWCIGLIGIIIVILFCNNSAFRNTCQIDMFMYLKKRKVDSTQIFGAQIIDNGIKVVDVSLIDLPRVSVMCNNQFLSPNSTLFERLDLNRRIVGLFVPKLLDSKSGGHEVIGLKDISNNLVGIIDLSLQPSDGSLTALQPSTLMSRMKLYKTLEPYICNLLVSPEFRNKGFGSQLLQECERRVRERSLGPFINLHVELEETAALKLYLKNGYVETRRIGRGLGNDILFLRKKITS